MEKHLLFPEITRWTSEEVSDLKYDTDDDFGPWIREQDLIVQTSFLLKDEKPPVLEHPESLLANILSLSSMNVEYKQGGMAQVREWIVWEFKNRLQELRKEKEAIPYYCPDCGGPLNDSPGFVRMGPNIRGLKLCENLGHERK